MEMPFAGVPVIVCFGVPYRLDGERFETFVAGMTDRPVATEFTGAAGGVQIDLTPLGARRILGIPMEELTRRMVAVEELLGRELVERLRDAPGWRERFALLDAALLRRVDAGPAPAPEVAWSYARLAAADGRVAAGALADEVGWSRRHLAARWAAAPTCAYDCGFSDQPHLNREFRTLGGSTPGEVTNLQDVAAAPV